MRYRLRYLLPTSPVKKAPMIIPSAAGPKITTEASVNFMDRILSANPGPRVKNMEMIAWAIVIKSIAC